MNLCQRIKAYFLLSIISLIILQNTLPHIHHIHGDHSAEVPHHHTNTSSHTHRDNHDHTVFSNVHHEHHTSKLDFLSILLENHSHIHHSLELIQSAKIKHSKVHHLIYHLTGETHNLISQKLRYNQAKRSIFAYVPFNHHYLTSFSFRGPPLLSTLFLG